MPTTSRWRTGPNPVVGGRHARCSGRRALGALPVTSLGLAVHRHHMYVVATRT